jgi:hypothetical protein
VDDLPDHFFVRVDGAFEVALVRTPEGLVVDVYPNGKVQPADTVTVREGVVAEVPAGAGT